MRIKILFFSQTGATEKIARTFESAFLSCGHEVELRPLLQIGPGEHVQADLIAVGSPCFASRAPSPVKERLRSLVFEKGQKAFVFATSGGAPGRVLWELGHLLAMRDVCVLGGFLTRGELFHPAPCLIGRMKGRPTEGDIERAKDFATSLSNYLHNSEQGQISWNREEAKRKKFGFYDLVGAIASDSLLRLLLPKPKRDQVRCSECSTCARECPSGALAESGQLENPLNCIRCYRCLNICPNNAYSVDWRFGNLALLSLYNSPFERMFGDLEKSEQIYPE